MGLDAFGIGAIADLAKDLVGRFFPDKTEQEKGQMALILATMQNQMAMNQGQMDINEVEAANPNFFVSGWRPWVGWVCGSACLELDWAPHRQIHHRAFRQNFSDSTRRLDADATAIDGASWHGCSSHL